MPAVETAAQPVAPELPEAVERERAKLPEEPVTEERPVMAFVPRGSMLFGVSMEEMIAERKRRWQRRLLLLIILVVVLVAAYLTSSQWLPAVQPYFPESGISK